MNPKILSVKLIILQGNLFERQDKGNVNERKKKNIFSETLPSLPAILSICV
jgi:hypothetical protein